MKPQFIPIILIFTFLSYTCGDNLISSKQIVAKVYDKYLLREEVAQLIPPETSSQDSLMMANNYVKKWITRELLLYKAQQNLTDEEKNIRQQVEEYASAILIHKYKKKLISQKVQTRISQEEIEQYYNQHKYNFVLPTDVVRAQIIILPKTASNINNVRKWFKSNDVQNQAALEEYCITNAKKFDNFNNQWIELRDLLNILPIQQDDWYKKYHKQSHIELEDDENHYFLKINEMFKAQATAPLGYAQKAIETILRNKKKMAFEEELEKQINNEGRRKNHVQIFK